MQHMIWLCVFVCVVHTGNAQDIHFSNFYTNVLHVNPAFAGFFNGNHRFSLTARDQYRTVAVPYQTVTVAYDSKYSIPHNRRNHIGYGAILAYDKAGDSYFSSTQFSIPLIYHVRTTQNIWQVSYGILPGLFSNGIDYAYLRFPDQFDGISYNPDVPTFEEFENTGKIFFNLGSGIRAMYTPDKRYRYGIGFAMYNMFQPNISFFDDKDIVLPRRYLVHAMSQIELNSRFDLLPALKFQFQGSQQEYHFGAMILYHTNNVTIPRLTGGIWFRSRDRDAIILGIGGVYNGYEIVLNYDINISSLQTASKGHGAMEITVSYILFEHQKRRKMAPVKCPGFL